MKDRQPSGLPKGIVKPGKKYQARIFYPASDSAHAQGHKSGPRNIGSFDTLEEAVEKLAIAQAKFDADGEAAVWDAPPAARAPKNMCADSYQLSNLHVCSLEPACMLALSSHQQCASRPLPLSADLPSEAAADGRITPPRSGTMARPSRRSRRALGTARTRWARMAR